MKPTLLVVVGLAALATAHARGLSSDALLTATTGDATTQTSTEATCRHARDLARQALHDKHDALHGLLHNCTHWLLFAGYKWVDADHAKDYCKSDACRQLVTTLDADFPACTWDDIPSDSARELLMAQRVRQDCKA